MTGNSSVSGATSLIYCQGLAAVRFVILAIKQKNDKNYSTPGAERMGALSALLFRQESSTTEQHHGPSTTPPPHTNFQLTPFLYFSYVKLVT